MRSLEDYAAKLNRLLREARTLTDPITHEGQFTWRQFYFRTGHEDLRSLGYVKLTSPRTAPGTWWVCPDCIVTVEDVKKLRAARRRKQLSRS